MEATRIPLARFIQLEATLVNMIQDMKNLKDISVTHGSHIRDLFSLTSNSLSKVEFMAATAAMAQLHNATASKPHIKPVTDTPVAQPDQTSHFDDNDMDNSRGLRLLSKLKNRKLDTLRHLIILTILGNELTRIENDLCDKLISSRGQIKKLEADLHIHKLEIVGIRKEIKELKNSTSPSSIEIPPILISSIKREISERLSSEMNAKFEVFEAMISQLRLEQLQDKTQIYEATQDMETLIVNHANNYMIRQITQSLCESSITEAVANINKIKNTPRKKPTRASTIQTMESAHTSTVLCTIVAI